MIDDLIGRMIERLFIRLLNRPAVRAEVLRLVEEEVQRSGPLRHAIKQAQASIISFRRPGPGALE